MRKLFKIFIFYIMKSNLLLIKYLKHFYLFLRQNHCLREFNKASNTIDAVHTREQWGHPSRFSSFIIKYHDYPQVWIQNCFNWQNSDEGFDYWAEINDMWCKYIKEYYNYDEI